MITNPNVTSKSRHWTADELRKMPASERDSILLASATLAETVYGGDQSLIDFDAFSEEDLDGHSSSADQG